MASLEIHPLSELRDEAARLLGERFARQRAAEPLLPEIDDFEPHLPTDGDVATRGRTAVAFLGGSVDEEHRMARWTFAGHAASEPEALRALFAKQAAESGLSRFMLTVPASATELVDVWFRSAFGCQAVWAVQEVAPVDSPSFDGTIRASEPDDLEAIVDFDLLLYEHQIESPSFSGFAAPSREASREEARDMWGDATQIPFVAEADGRIVGFLLLYRRPTGDLRVPEQNIDLAFAATHEDFRGRGAGLALYAHAMSWAAEQGFRSMTVDWRSVNLQSSTFWPRRGFRPQYLRLYRAVP